MNTAQVSIELVLAGILALCAFVLPFWRGAEISQNLLQTDALIGVVGVAYLLGVVFDKLADILLSPMENYLRLKQTDKILDKAPDPKPKDAFPQNKLEFELRMAKDGRLDWMNSLRSRIRTSREVAVLGLPATLGIAVYLGVTRDCIETGSQTCSAQWIYLLVALNLLFFVLAAWMESNRSNEEPAPAVKKRPGTEDLDHDPTNRAEQMESNRSDEEPASSDKKRLRTEDLDHDPTKRAEQMEKAKRQMWLDSAIYYLMVINSALAIAAVALLKAENSWIALIGAGGLIISLLSLWTCLRITRTYMSFIARANRKPAKEKSA